MTEQRLGRIAEQVKKRGRGSGVGMPTEAIAYVLEDLEAVGDDTATEDIAPTFEPDMDEGGLPPEEENKK